jgi:carbamate kinase
MPLYIAGADSGGGVGYLLQRTLHNELVNRGLSRSVVTIVTQMVVLADDPAFAHPSKPIGPYMSPEDARSHAKERGWTVREQPGGGWRRVVASPLPLEIVESLAICTLARTSAIVIAAGGGGVPVVRSAQGQLSGVDAVVDKDWTGALLARALGADTYVVLMETDGVYRGWDTRTHTASADSRPRKHARFCALAH